jgi:hypothetical protein
MTKIYQNLGAGEDKKLRAGTTKCVFIINYAHILHHVYEGEDALGLSLREKSGDTSCGYGLIGKVKDEFMSEMGVGGVEELVGKEIIGYIHKDEYVLQGLSVRKLEKKESVLDNFSKN